MLNFGVNLLLVGFASHIGNNARIVVVPNRDNFEKFITTNATKDALIAAKA